MNNDTTVAFLRGMIFPRFITKPISSIYRIFDSIDNPKEWFSTKKCYEDDFILNSIAHYLFNCIKDLEIDVVLSEEKNQKLNSELSEIFKDNKYRLKSLIIDEKHKNGSLKKKIQKKDICFVNDIVIDREEVDKIVSFAKEVNGKLVSYVSLFNFTNPGNNPLEISIFNRDDIKRYKIWGLVGF